MQQEIKPGLKFTSTNFKGNCRVLDVNETAETLNVEITTNGVSRTEEGWNLQHTIWGFERGEYVVIATPKEPTVADEAKWRQENPEAAKWFDAYKSTTKTLGETFELAAKMKEQLSDIAGKSNATLFKLMGVEKQNENLKEELTILRDREKMVMNVLKGDDDPEFPPPLYNIEWLSTLLKYCEKPPVSEAIISSEKHRDDDAFFVMITTLKKLVEDGRKVLVELSNDQLKLKDAS